MVIQRPSTKGAEDYLKGRPNATSTAASNATALSKSNYSNGTFFGMLVVFDDLVTAEQTLSSTAMARVQGFYIYDEKEVYNAWIAFSLVFNSTAYRVHPQPHGRRPHVPGHLRRRWHQRLVHGTRRRHAEPQRRRGRYLLPVEDGHQAL
ncbi:hypothetical protein ACP70R_005308 [Stipagrostis hirtigluma subsp. patula]